MLHTRVEFTATLDINCCYVAQDWANGGRRDSHVTSLNLSSPGSAVAQSHEPQDAVRRCLQPQYHLPLASHQNLCQLSRWSGRNQPQKERQECMEKGSSVRSCPFIRPQGRDGPPIAWPRLRQVIAERGEHHVVDGLGRYASSTGPAALCYVRVLQAP